jgi:hypothetical protein
MPKTGRNDPCPCGSGRKYKQCCLPKVQATQVRALSRRRDEELLWARLLAYAQRPTFSVDVQSAFGLFWNGDYDLSAADALSREMLMPFLEWYIQDYRTSKDRQRIIDLFAAEEGPRLSPEHRALLAEREVAYLSLYGIEQVDPEGYLEVGDLLAGGFFRVEEPGLARLAMPGDLVLGRRFGDQEDGRLSPGTVLLPASLAPVLVGAAKRAYAAYRDESYQATWPQFLRESGYLMYHALLAPEASEAYERVSQLARYFDPRPSVKEMQAITHRRMEEAIRRQQEKAGRRAEVQGEAPTAPAVERTAGGILIPGQPKASPSGGGIVLPEHLRKPPAT